MRAPLRLARLALLAALLLAAGCARPAPGRAESVGVRAPARSPAGQAAPVTVAAPGLDDGAPVTVTAITSFGPRVYRAAAAGGQATVIIPGDDLRAAGEVLIVARAGEAEASARMAVEPGQPAGPQTTLVGPRTIAADGSESAMAVLVPFDADGNSPPDGTLVTVRTRYPDGREVAQEARVSGGLAWVRVDGGGKTGTIVVAAEAGGARALEADLSATAGWPVPFALASSSPPAPADGRRLITVRSERIRDRLGNPLADGTLVMFSATMPDGTLQRIPAYTIDGVAEAQVQAPSDPGEALLVASVRGVASAPLRVSFSAGPAVGQLAVAVAVDDRGGALTLTAGPLVGPLGQLAPDGTRVTFRLLDAAGRVREIAAESEGGSATATARLSDLAPGAGSAEAAAGSARGRALFVIPVR